MNACGLSQKGKVTMRMPCCLIRGGLIQFQRDKKHGTKRVKKEKMIKSKVTEGCLMKVGIDKKSLIQ